MSQFSAAFWKWFGNSVVRNEDGSPRVVYHGGDCFSTFSATAKREAGSGGSDSALGFFFTASPGVAQAFAGSEGCTTRAYLKIERPEIIEAYRYFRMINDSSRMREKDFREMRRGLISEGRDGIIIPGNGDIALRYGSGWIQFDADTFVVFRARQIKAEVHSADNNPPFRYTGRLGARHG